MSFDWQTMIALACVAMAALFLARRAQRLFAGGGGCGGGCGSCAAKSSARGGDSGGGAFVALESLEDFAPRP